MINNTQHQAAHILHTSQGTLQAEPEDTLGAVQDSSRAAEGRAYRKESNMSYASSNSTSGERALLG